MSVAKESPSDSLVDGRSGVIIAAAMVLANVANYGFQIVCGRILTIEEYGLLAGLMSVVTVITVATSSLQATAARAIAADEHTVGGSPFDVLTRSALLVSLLLAVALAVVSPIMSRFFNVGALPLILLGVYIVPSALDSLAAGRLQGMHRFSAMSLYSASQAFAKLAVAAVLLTAGLRATGLVAGLSLSAGLVAFIGILATRQAGAIEVHALAPDVRRAFAAFTIFWFVLGADVLFARAFFDATEAGIYSAASVLGKAVLWVPAVVAQLLFPRLARRSKDGSSVDRLAMRAVAIVGVIVAVTASMLFAFGDIVFRVLYGARYEPAADIAWKIGLAVAPLALVNLLIHHFLARGQGHFLGWMLGVVVAEVLVLYLGPKTPEFYALTLFGVGCALLVTMVPPHAWKRTLFRVLRVESRREARTAALVE